MWVINEDSLTSEKCFIIAIIVVSSCSCSWVCVICVCAQLLQELHFLCASYDVHSRYELQYCCSSFYICRPKAGIYTKQEKIYINCIYFGSFSITIRNSQTSCNGFVISSLTNGFHVALCNNIEHCTAGSKSTTKTAHNRNAWQCNARQQCVVIFFQHAQQIPRIPIDLLATRKTYRFGRPDFNYPNDWWI